MAHTSNTSKKDTKKLRRKLNSLPVTAPTSYFEKTRDLVTSFALVFPVFLIYQIGILATGGLRNGVDFVTNSLFALSGGSLLYYLGFNLGIFVLYTLVFLFLRKNGTIYLSVIPGVLVESIVYATLLGGTIISIMSSLGLGSLLAADGAALAHTGVFTNFIMSLGAGLYEEIVFRLLLLGGLFAAGTRLLRLPTWASAFAAVLISSVIFSAIHYIGPLGDPFQLGSFTFRFFAGVLFAVIYYTRGFAIAVYTHAIYDIIVLIFR